MQRHRRFWGALLAAVLAIGILPAASAADKDGPSAPGLAALATDPGGLNGLSGQNDDFDYTRYDAVIDISDIVYEFGTHNGFYYELRDDFTWPGGTTILITVGHSSDEAVLDYIDVPGGKIVDVYDFGTAMDRSYTFWAHYDTTGGAQTGEPSGSGQGSYSSSFSDVQPGAWYYDAVMTMADNGILGGYGNGKFGPDDPLTYQQLWTILDRICNYEEVYDIWTTNGNNTWSTKIVTRGGAAYYMAGAKWSSYSNTGHNYYDIVAMTALHKGIDGLARKTIDEFPDAEAIRAYSVDHAKDYVNDHPDELETVTNMSEMIQKAIVNAYNYDFFAGVDSQGTFSPYAEMTRAQLCQALYRAGVYDKVD